jgi:precorrin-6B methylase 1
MMNYKASPRRDGEGVSRFADPLPFRLSGFLGVVWASAQARDGWAPTLSRIRGVVRGVQWRSVAMGVRSCALLTGEDAEDISLREESASCGLSCCELSGSDMTTSRYWLTEAAIERKPNWHGIVIADRRRLREFLTAWQERDYGIVDRMLGVPDCCAKTYRILCGDGDILDPTWVYARRSNPDVTINTITVRASDARVTATNTLLRWIGIRAVPYFPCSYECSATADVVQTLKRMAEEAGSGREWDSLMTVLSWPSEWTALHGIAEVGIPILKFRTATDATAGKYTVRWAGSSFPREGAAGLGFPYRGALAPRERRIMLPLIANDNVQNATSAPSQRQPGGEPGDTPELETRTKAHPRERPVTPEPTRASPLPGNAPITDDVTAAPDEGIVIVGSGIKVPEQLTIQALRVLAQASEIWTNVPEAEHPELAKAIGQTPHSLWSFFRSDRPRMANYEAIVAHLLQRAGAVRQVAYLTQGHPMVLDRVATDLLRQGGDGGIRVNVIPGMSSIDTILADLRYEPARGLQVFDATNFVRREMKIDGRAGLLLLQPGVFGTDMPRLTSDAPAPQLTALRDTLCKTYPERHPAILIRSATARMPRQRFQTTVGELDGVPVRALAASTLWIPPLDFERQRSGGSPTCHG